MKDKFFFKKKDGSQLTWTVKELIMETSLIWLDYRCDVCESNQTCWSAWPMPDKYLIHFSNVLRFFKSELWRAPWAGSLWTLTGIDSRGLLMKQQRWRFMGWAFGPLKSSWWSTSNVIGASSPRSDTLLRVSWSIKTSSGLTRLRIQIYYYFNI